MIVIKISGLPSISQSRLRILHKSVIAEIKALGSLLELRLSSGYVGNRKVVCYSPVEMSSLSAPPDTIFVEATIYNETENHEDVRHEVGLMIEEGINAVLPNMVVICTVTTYVPPPQFWFMQNMRNFRLKKLLGC